MFNLAFATKACLKDASRLPSLSGHAGISAAELTILLGCGALAAFAVGMVHLRIGVPGHAILRAVLPMAMGLALVPRHSAGMTMAIAAGATSAAMSVGQIGFFPPAAMLSVLALGPVMDLALLGNPQGWRLYLRFAMAGAVANLLAFALKTMAAWLGWEIAGSGQFMRYGSMALVTFVVCGALAGLVSAALWFRLRVDDDLCRS